MITPDEVRLLVKELDLTDPDIEKFVNDAEDFLGIEDTPQSTTWDRAVKYYAAYLAFISSDLYTRVKVGDLAVSRDVKFKAQSLLRTAIDALKEIDPEVGAQVLEDTYMIDRERPDFIKGGVEDWYD